MAENSDKGIITKDFASKNVIKELAYKSAAESITLLKNENDILPLNKATIYPPNRTCGKRFKYFKWKLGHTHGRALINLTINGHPTIFEQLKSSFDKVNSYFGVI